MPSLLLPGVLLWATVATTSAAETTPPKEPVAAETPGEKSEFEKDTPPVTEYDRKQETTIPIEPRRDLLSQVAQTIFALVVVLGLIFLFSKYGLSRLTGLRTGASGQHIQIVERLQLDPKHTLYLVDVEGMGSLLLGGGDGDLRLITPVNAETDPSPNSPFSATLAQTKSGEINSSSGKGSES